MYTERNSKGFYDSEGMLRFYLKVEYYNEDINKLL